MRNISAIALICFSLAACGGTTEKTVVVNPAPGSTTVVDADGHTKVVKPANCGPEDDLRPGCDGSR